VIRRPTRLIPERMMLETLRDLALSLQIYNKGTYDSAKPPYRPATCTSMH